MKLKIMETTSRFNLELSFMQVLQLEVILENKIEMLYKNELDATREEQILKKIYSILPTTDRKFKNL